MNNVVNVFGVDFSSLKPTVQVILLLHMMLKLKLVKQFLERHWCIHVKMVSDNMVEYMFDKQFEKTFT